MEDNHMTPSTAQQRAEAIKLYTNLFHYQPDTERLEAGEDTDYETIMRALQATRQEALKKAATVVRSMAGELTRENCSGCGNVDDEAAGDSNDALRYAADELDRLASEGA